MSGRPSTGFLLLLGPTPTGTVLEIGEDRGERAQALRSAGFTVSCVRRTDEQARPLRDQGFEAHVAVGPADFGVPSGAFDAVVFAAALGRTRGSEWVTPDLTGPARGAAAALRAGGALVLALPNPLYDLPGLGRVLAWLDPSKPSEGAPRGRVRLLPIGERSIRRAIEAAGFDQVEVFAALPGAFQPKFLVPLRDRAVVSYFLRDLMPRPGTSAKRALMVLASVTARAGLFESVVPAFEISARKAVSP